jgi:arsenate reductase
VCSTISKGTGSGWQIAVEAANLTRMADESCRDDAERIRALAPRHVLFMCVANSARSQLAEGIARSLTRDVRISSAGSSASHVHPLAILALAEIGIDPSQQFSKGLEEVDVDGVDVVVTLCAEEVCPLFPHPTERFHWPFPDPVGRARTAEEALEGFRAARDELRRRLEVVFAA